MLNCCIQLCILIKLPHYKHFLSSLFSTLSLLLSGSFVISDNLYAGSVFGLWLLSGFSFSSVAGPPPAGKWVDVPHRSRFRPPAPLSHSVGIRGRVFSCRALLMVSVATYPITASPYCSEVPQPPASSKRKYFLKSELGGSAQDVFSASLA